MTYAVKNLMKRFCYLRDMEVGVGFQVENQVSTSIPRFELKVNESGIVSTLRAHHRARPGAQRLDLDAGPRLCRAGFVVETSKPSGKFSGN